MPCTPTLSVDPPATPICAWEWPYTPATPAFGPLAPLLPRTPQLFREWPITPSPSALRPQTPAAAGASGWRLVLLTSVVPITPTVAEGKATDGVKCPPVQVHK